MYACIEMDGRLQFERLAAASATILDIASGPARCAMDVTATWLSYALVGTDCTITHVYDADSTIATGRHACNRNGCGAGAGCIG